MEISAIYLLNNCTSYSFVGDKSTGLYHNRSCELLSSLNPNTIQGCGKNPEDSGFLPCPKCLPSRVAKPRSIKKVRKKPKTKAELIKEQLIRISEAYGMHVQIVGNVAFVTSVAGEWYYNYCERPIKLRHQNTEQRFDAQGRSTGFYHKQDYEFASPAHALAYIHRHEQATIRRLMCGEETIN